MSSYDKVVRLACKPKAAPPKPKYLDPILAATWSDDGTMHDVCKALSPRFRETNVIVVFKALIVLHSMIRNGSTDNVLGYLSKSEVLRLHNVSAGNWDGYEAPQNVQNYAIYLESRIRAYQDLKHDAICVQSESNRDLRNSRGIEDDMTNRSSTRSKGRSQSADPRIQDGPSRSKTVMGRKLRNMAVEKGLLRETQAVQRMIATLVECRFYEDNLEDELATTALNMLVKDLLILFQASNEGVINLLEHYFEMSYIDAKQALAIYRSFCKQTEHVVNYLSIAKKLQNVLHVPIPNLKHPPISLVGALQEYLSDPDFEKNRREYRENKRVADRDASPSKSNTAPTVPPKPSSSPSSSVNQTSVDNSNIKTAPGKRAMQDFFAAIEEEAPSMFDTQTNRALPFFQHQQTTPNPFGQFGVVPQATGFMTMPQAFQVPQPTGFPSQPFQPTGQNPFPKSFVVQPTQAQSTQHRPFSTFLQPQATMVGLQPQMTGGPNPFRQSMFLPQATGLVAFPGQQMPNFLTGQPITTTPSTFSSTNAMSPPPPNQYPWMTGSVTPSQMSLPQRPASTPLTAIQPENKYPVDMQPMRPHQTGSRNPFGTPLAPIPAIPKPPTMMELAMAQYQTNSSPLPTMDAVNPEKMGRSSTIASSNARMNSKTMINETNGTFPRVHAFETLNGGNMATDMSSIASSFSGPTSFKPSSISGTSNMTFFSSQPIGTTAAATSSLTTSLQAQPTGLPAIKPFKPSSNFGTSLLESLPPLPHSQANTDSSIAGLPNSNTSSSAWTSQNMGNQTTGMGESGLRPQMTGGPNPFRASTFSPPGGFGTVSNGMQTFSSMEPRSISTPFSSVQPPAGPSWSQPTGNIL